MYETIEFFNSDGSDLKEVLKSCLYKYYMVNKNIKDNSSKLFKKNKKDVIIDTTNKVNVLSSERR